MPTDPQGSAALHTCTSDPQQPCEPCTAAYLRIKRNVDTSAAKRRATCSWGQPHTVVVNADGRLRKHKRYDPLRWHMRECEGSGEVASDA